MDAFDNPLFETNVEDECLICMREFDDTSILWNCSGCTIRVHMACIDSWNIVSGNIDNTGNYINCPQCKTENEMVMNDEHLTMHMDDTSEQQHAITIPIYTPNDEHLTMRMDDTSEQQHAITIPIYTPNIHIIVPTRRSNRCEVVFIYCKGLMYIAGSIICGFSTLILLGMGFGYLLSTIE